MSLELTYFLNFAIPAVCWVGTYLLVYHLLFKKLFLKGKLKKAAAIALSVLIALIIGSLLTMWIVLLVFNK